MEISFLGIILLNSLLLFVLLAIIPIAILRDGQRIRISRRDQVLWIIVSVGFFPIGLLLYLLIARRQSDKPDCGSEAI